MLSWRQKCSSSCLLESQSEPCAEQKRQFGTRIMGTDTKLKDSLLPAKIWYRTRWWWSSWNNILMLQWTSFPELSAWRRDTSDFTPPEKEVSNPIPCLLTLSSACTYVQVSRNNLENTDTGQEQFKPANKFNEMQTLQAVAWTVTRESSQYHFLPAEKE